MSLISNQGLLTNPWRDSRFALRRLAAVPSFGTLLKLRMKYIYILEEDRVLSSRPRSCLYRQGSWSLGNPWIGTGYSRITYIIIRSSNVKPLWNDQPWNSMQVSRWFSSLESLRVKPRLKRLKRTELGSFGGNLRMKRGCWWLYVSFTWPLANS